MLLIVRMTSTTIGTYCCCDRLLQALHHSTYQHPHINMSHSSPPSTTYSKHALATTITVNLAACLERLDEQVVPALYDALGDAFDATPVQLSMLTLSRALIQALASPMGGVLGQHCNRAHVLAAGCMLWGCMTCLFGMLRSLHVGYLVWGINGIGLALVIPTTQSLVADYSSREKRGRAFGMLACTAAVGAMLGSVYATNVGGWSHGAIQGWRLVLVSVGLLSVAVGVVGLVVVRDPGYSLHGIRHTPVARFTLVGFGRQLGAVLSIPTFSLIVLQVWVVVMVVVVCSAYCAHAYKNIPHASVQTFPCIHKHSTCECTH